MEVIRKNQNTRAVVNGKIYYLPTPELDKLKNNLNISFEEAVNLWLDDNGYTINEEQNILNEKASKVQIDVGAEQKKSAKPRKKPEKRISDEKKELFSEILSDLQDVYRENVTVLKENKLILVKINNKTFKIDVIESRKA